MSDAKAPERIWASYRKQPEQLYAYPWKGWEGNQLETEYIRFDLYAALAKERDELAAVVERQAKIIEDERALNFGEFEILDSVNKARAEKAEDEVERLREVLAEVAQTLDWRAHGCCRGWSENLLSSSEALTRARAALQRKEGNE